MRGGLCKMPARNEGRNEKRNAIRAPLQLASLDSPGISERAITENVSLMGTRVVTKRPWPAGQNVLIVTSASGGRVRARVIYCQVLDNERFAIGLKFLEASAGQSLVLTGRSA
jgi:hypothetical protein